MGVNTLRIQSLQTAHLTQIMSIEEEAFPDPWSRSLFEAELHHDWSFQFVLTDKGLVRAYIVFWLVLDEVHVLNLATHPRHRGMGHASRLLAHAIQVAIKRKARYITLEVRRSNYAAIRLYQKVGFLQEAVRPRYYADNQEDALIMTLFLNEIAA